MARKPRQHLPGDIQHVMAHGIDSLNLFESDQDCSVFLDILSRYFLKYACHCYGYCLMGNHYHLIIRPSGDCDSFSRLLRDIDSVYARYLNKSRERRGYVFRERPKSIPTRDPGYVRRLIAYVNANPVRAGFCDTPEELASYRWCSHRDLLCPQKSRDWLQTEYMHGLFDAANTSYSDFLTTTLGEEFDAWHQEQVRENPVTALPPNLCDTEESWVRDQIQKTERNRAFREKVRRIPGHLGRLLEISKTRIQVPPNPLDPTVGKQGFRNAVALFSHWTVHIAGYPASFIGKILEMDGSTILRAAGRGRRLAGGEPFPIPV